ncbi:MAG TPA: hypothetical protein VGD89_05605 [Flavipsychrobacter sp.]
MYIYGYRSILFRVALVIVVCAVAACVDMFTLMGAVLFSIALNINIVDIKRIEIADDVINITRYFKLSQYDIKLRLKDIRTVELTEKKYTGPKVDGSGRRGSYAYWRLEVALHDGNVVDIELLGMLGVERTMLIRKLNKLMEAYNP